jgi:hypothetical protein
MNKTFSPVTGSGLRQRLVEDMTVRGFSEKIRRYYIRIVAGFAAFLGRSPDTATAEDIRRFQVHQSELRMRAPAMNSTVAALSFFYTHALDRPDLARQLLCAPMASDMRPYRPTKLPVCRSRTARKPPQPPTPAQPNPQLPISLSPETAGSFSEDFRTPTGVRNSSRKLSIRLPDSVP